MLKMMEKKNNDKGELIDCFVYQATFGGIRLRSEVLGYVWS